MVCSSLGLPQKQVIAEWACPRPTTNIGLMHLEMQTMGQRIINTKIEPNKPRMADIENREICNSQELTQNLPLDALPSHNITLTLDNSRIFKTQPAMAQHLCCSSKQKP